MSRRCITPFFFNRFSTIPTAHHALSHGFQLARACGPLGWNDEKREFGLLIQQGLAGKKSPFDWNDESRNAGYIDKTEPERKSFAALFHLKVLQSRRLRFAFPRSPGWNGEGRVFEQYRQNQAGEKRLRSSAGRKYLSNTKPKATCHVQ